MEPVVTKITANDDVYRKVLADVLQQAKKAASSMTRESRASFKSQSEAAREHAREAKEAYHGIAESLHELNSESKKGLVHGLDTIIRGGGIALGIKLVADAAKEGTKTWADYKEGLVDLDEVIDKTVKSIPILGSIAEATENVMNALHARTLSDDERMLLKDLPRQDRLKKQFEVQADTLAAKGYGYEHARLDGRRQKLETLTTDLAIMQEILQKNAAINNLSESAEIQFSTAFEKTVKEYYLARDELHRAEESFVRTWRLSITNELAQLPNMAASLWRTQFFQKNPFGGTSPVGFMKDAKEYTTRLQDRQDEIDLESWRSAAQAQRDAEEALMPEEELKKKQDREKWLAIAADSRLDDKTRLEAKRRADTQIGVATFSGLVEAHQSLQAAAMGTGPADKVAPAVEKMGVSIDNVHRLIQEISKKPILGVSGP